MSHRLLIVRRKTKPDRVLNFSRNHGQTIFNTVRFFIISTKSLTKEPIAVEVSGESAVTFSQNIRNDGVTTN